MTKHLFLLFLLVSCLLSAQQVVINEIYFEPVPKTSPEEFVELYNNSAETVDLSGWFFSNGISFEFPEGALMDPGGYLVMAEDPQALQERAGDSVLILGPFSGSLSNEGERITLRNHLGEVVDTVGYDYGFPWPTATTGDGSSMELIHPSLDNDLGGSWRASGATVGDNTTRHYFLQGGATGWSFRKGTSNPDPDWLDIGYTEDASWQPAQTPIGYADGDDNTELTDMRSNYTSIYLRRTFTIENAEDLNNIIFLDVYVDDGAIVWLNGQEAARVSVTAGDKEYDDTGTNHEAEWEYVELSNPAAFLTQGENIICVHALNASITSSDFSIDAQLYIPSAQDLGGDEPVIVTPGTQNSVYSESVPPLIRHVDHQISTPTISQNNIITAKVTDADGVASVDLSYQAVAPGDFIPAFLPVPHAELLSDGDAPRPDNPAFNDPANWTTIPMRDDGTGGDTEAGDDTYAATIPRMSNRTLVRYRITATDSTGSSVLVPYADDPSLNFAYFVYNGVPDYQVQTSISGHSTTYSWKDLTKLPVYILITRHDDFMESIARYSSQQIPQGTQARFAFNWEGAVYHDGTVYDHITYRLRGANGRYQIPPGNPGDVAGKRMWRFRFRKGNHLKTFDHLHNRYENRWKMLNTGRLFGNRLDGNWGLSELVNYRIWNDYDVPAPLGHMFHWRVVDGAQEAPSGADGQYTGDFWGLARCFENYDAQFLETHDLPKGNLYKLVNQTTDALDQLRYQAADAVSDGSDHDNIENNLRSYQSDAWLEAHVNYDAWFRYHAICQAVRHYDFWADANKNAAWYFEPDYTPQNSYLGRMWTLPWDTDGTWGPTWNQGIDWPYSAISGNQSFQIRYRNHIREVRDLLWQRDQLEPIIRQTAAFISPLEGADIDRFRNAPAEECRQYFSAANQRTLEGKIADMLAFAFVGGSWPGGGVGAGGRAAVLDSLADGSDQSYLPSTPSITYTGDDSHPVNALTFRSSAFSDPQGAGTFKAMKWRIAKVSDIPNPGSIDLADPFWRNTTVHLELKEAWESEELTEFVPDITIPVRYVETNQTYRVRVRMCDTTNRWSHWSTPIEFTTGPPLEPIDVMESLRITELMYSPIGGADYEFIELQNRGPSPIDLSNVRFSDGISFDFRDGSIQMLDPGQIIVLVRNPEVFATRYNTAGITIAGEYSLKQENTGERITLTYGGDLEILDFSYNPTWYPETDEGGYSLNIVDINSSPESWNNPENWFSSNDIHGTPGSIETFEEGTGLLLPGDANLDGTLDLSDPIRLLLFLFSGTSLELPCDGATIAEGGNLVLLDFNGDEAINIADTVGMLRYLFAEGEPHTKGVYCIRIEGCPNTCWGGK